jgi:hypothetical protein
MVGFPAGLRRHQIFQRVLTTGICVLGLAIGGGLGELGTGWMRASSELDVRHFSPPPPARPVSTAATRQTEDDVAPVFIDRHVLLHNVL